MNKPFLLILLLSFGFSNAQEKGFLPLTNFEEYTTILESVRRNDQMLFVNLVDDNTEAGKRTKSQNRSAEFYNQIEGFKCLEIDVKTSLGAQWIQAFPVDELPAIYFLNKDEIILEITTGYQNSTSILELAKKNGSRKNHYQTLNSKYGNGSLSIEDWIELLRIHGLNFEFNRTYRLAMEFLNDLSKDELIKPNVIPVLEKFGVDLETKYPLFILNNHKVLSYTLSSFSYKSWFEKAYSYNLDRAIFSEDTNVLNLIVSPLIEKSEENEKASLVFATRQLYVEQTKQFSVMFQAVMDWTIEIEDSATRSRFIFDEAFKLADKNQETEAFAVAAKLAGEANKLQAEFRYKMLEAYSLYKVKDFAKAKELVSEAQALTTNTRNQDKAKNLLSMIQKAEK